VAVDGLRPGTACGGNGEPGCAGISWTPAAWRVNRLRRIRWTPAANAWPPSGGLAPQARARNRAKPVHLIPEGFTIPGWRPGHPSPPQAVHLHVSARAEGAASTLPRRRRCTFTLSHAPQARRPLFTISLRPLVPSAATLVSAIWAASWQPPDGRRRGRLPCPTWVLG